MTKPETTIGTYIRLSAKLSALDDYYRLLQWDRAMGSYDNAKEHFDRMGAVMEEIGEVALELTKMRKEARSQRLAREFA